MQDLIMPTLVALAGLVSIPHYYYKRKKALAIASTQSTVSPADETGAKVIDIMGQSISRRQPEPIFFDTVDEDAHEYEVRVLGLPTEEELANWTSDRDSVLLREAEHAVDTIQAVIEEQQSLSAKPTQILAAIRESLGRYVIFIDTEYFDAINNYIQLAVKRCTGIEVSTDELAALWKDL